ncbi:MAG: hypothetical protein J5771_03965 [Bacteroidales bacterium]|nr:hypothetical protein [Bacteroidales bacterium]
MKRLIILVFLLCAGLSAFAQDWKDKVVHPKYDVRLSIGGPNGLFTYPESQFERIGSFWKSDLKLSDIYEPYYEINAIPTFTAEFNWHPADFWYVGVDMSANKTWGLQFDPVTDTQISFKTFYSAYLMGKAAVYWVQFPHCKIYSSLYAGAELRRSNIHGDVSYGLKPAFDVNIGGVEWAGDVVFGFTEIVFGTRMNFIKLGVGYRF